jgi:hypothetical protein
MRLKAQPWGMALGICIGVLGVLGWQRAAVRQLPPRNLDFEAWTSPPITWVPQTVPCGGPPTCWTITPVPTGHGESRTAAAAP